MPAAHFRARATLSNTSPTRPYRSAGRPEVIFVMERLIDLAARECGFDRVALRRSNLVTEKEMPYKNPFGVEYDNGDYIGAMDMALKLGDWRVSSAAAPRRRKRGKCRGIGVANYVDISTGVPREKAEITVKPEGIVELVIGITSQGQGHETSFAQIVTEWLGVPIESVRFVTGDTDRVTVGGGAHSGRGMRLGSIVIKKSSDDIIEKGARIAEQLLETARRRYRIQEWPLHRERHQSCRRPVRSGAGGGRAPRSAGGFARSALRPHATRPCSRRASLMAAHVCEVEVDPETGGASSLIMPRSTMSAARSIR